MQDFELWYFSAMWSWTRESRQKCHAEILQVRNKRKTISRIVTIETERVSSGVWSNLKGTNLFYFWSNRTPAWTSRLQSDSIRSENSSLVNHKKQTCGVGKNRGFFDGFPGGGRRQTDLTLQGFVVSQRHVEDSLSVVYRPAVSAVWSVKLRVHGWASIHVFDQHTHTQTPRTQSPLVLHRFFRESQRQIPWYDLHFLAASPAVWIVISCTPDERRRREHSWGGRKNLRVCFV